MFIFIFLFPDGEIEVRDSWDLDYKPPVGTYVYEPAASLMPWTIQRPNGPAHLSWSGRNELPPQCKAIELLYPREGGRRNIFTGNLCQEIVDPNYKGK